MEIAGPSLDGVESDSLRHHVLTTLATNVKWSLVTHLRTAHVLTLNYHERFLLCEVALARDYF
jgi:hypothetical protein